MANQSLIDRMVNLLIEKLKGECAAIAVVWASFVVFLGISAYSGMRMVSNGETARFAFIIVNALQLTGAAILTVYSFTRIKAKLKRSCVAVWGQLEGTCASVSDTRSIVFKTINERSSLIMITISFALPLMVPTASGVLSFSQFALWVDLIAVFFILSQAIAMTVAAFYTKDAVDGIVYFED